MDLTMTTTPPTPYRDGSRKAAVSLLALLHQARHARSPTSTVSIRHPTAAHDSLGQPFEEVTKTHELPSLHQLTSLFDAVACNTNTHPDPSRVPPLVTAAMSLLSRAPAWSSRLRAEPWLRVALKPSPLNMPTLLPWDLQVRCMARPRCSPAPTGASCCSPPSASRPSTWTTTTSASCSSSGCTPATAKASLSTTRAHPLRASSGRAWRLWARHTLPLDAQPPPRWLPIPRPLSIQALRQLMCPPATGAAAGRAAKRPGWGERRRGLRQRWLRLWAAAQLPRLRPTGRLSRAPTATGSTTCGATLPGAPTGLSGS